MTTAFVIGNGTSRQGLDLVQLRNTGLIYGCNALYRDYTPDVLVSTDTPIATEIQQSGYSAKHRFYTRRPLPGLGAITVPKPYYGFSSGPIATALAAMDRHNTVYLVGFDMAPVNNKINNIYAGTQFYRDSTAPPTYTGNWIKQLCQVFQEFSTVNFVRVIGNNTGTVAEFNRFKNYENLPWSAFQDRINNQKDL